MDSSEAPEPASRTPSCDLLSHTVGPEVLFPGSQEQRGRLNLSDRKLSLQERSHTAASPCSSPGLNGRYIYPSLPYSPITSPHSSPRLPRRPTVESHSVSITDLQVGGALTPTLVFKSRNVSLCPVGPSEAHTEPRIVLTRTKPVSKQSDLCVCLNAD